MKKTVIFFSLVVLAFLSCKKETKENELSRQFDEQTPPEEHEEDNYSLPSVAPRSNDFTARLEYYRSIESVFEALETTNFGNRLPNSEAALPCSVDGVDTTGGRYLISFGKECFNRNFSGEILVELLPLTNKWNEKGSVLSLEYRNYKVDLEHYNGNALIYNGRLTITNVNGGWVYEVIQKNSRIEHKIRGNLNITFDNNETRSWHIFKRKIFNIRDEYELFKGQVGAFEVELHADSAGDIAETGVTKSGENFTTKIPNSYPLYYSNCESPPSIEKDSTLILTSGSLYVTASSYEMKAYAGTVNEIHGPVDLQSCHFGLGFMVVWNQDNQERTEFYPY